MDLVQYHRPISSTVPYHEPGPKVPTSVWPAFGMPIPVSRSLSYDSYIVPPILPPISRPL